MNTKGINKTWKWALYAVVLGGLTYSGLALTAKTAYASSCDCNEEFQDAQAICAGYGTYVNPNSFQCPVDPGLTEFDCVGGPYNLFTACD
jgi:hypothetical protein